MMFKRIFSVILWVDIIYLNAVLNDNVYSLVGSVTFPAGIFRIIYRPPGSNLPSCLLYLISFSIDFEDIEILLVGKLWLSLT